MAGAPLKAAVPPTGTDIAAEQNASGHSQQTVTIGEAGTNATAKLVTAIDGLIRAMQVQAPRALQYARTVTDAMRVNVENTVPVTGTVTVNGTVALGAGAAQVGGVTATMQSSSGANYGGYAPWNTNAGSFTAIDSREELLHLSMANWHQTRQRWSVT